MKTLLATCIAFAIALSFVPASSAYDPYARSTTVGNYYIYVFEHGLQIWEETNGLGADSPCSVIEGLPLAHVPFTGPTPDMGTMSGLQAENCGLGFAIDTYVL